MKNKMLIISPHFSTGGAPQVTLKKIQLLMDEYDLMVVEYSFLSWKYVVQRNAVQDILGKEKFITLSGNNLEKGNMINNILKYIFCPDIVSMEEFPEMFMADNVSDIIYSNDRNYKITETTHDSSFPISLKKYYPDKFIFVSAYNAIRYAHLEIPIDLIEYPVDILKRDKISAKKSLGLDLSYKHVVIVGLFTPRKNQEYAFRMAEKLKEYNLIFHFLGNQAENFTHYWMPLLENKPNNCIIWGERGDVSKYLEASDLFLFPSKGDRGNKELNPIVIKESSQYTDLPKLLYNLDVYLEKYSECNSFYYLTGDVDKDSEMVLSLTNSININKMSSEEIIIVGTYPNLKKREQLTIDCINSLKPLNRKIMLVSHYPVSEEIQKLVDYYIYDSENPLTHHSYYTKFYNYKAEYDVEININGLKKSNQSLTVLTNLNNAFKAALYHNYKKAFYITYDVIVNEKDYDNINMSFSSINDTCKAYLATINTPFGYGIQTTAMTFDVEYFLNSIDDVRTPKEYNDVCLTYGSQNFLEDYFMKVVNKLQSDSYKLITNEHETFLVNSGLGVSSNSEYYSIVPIIGKDNAFMFYFFTYNIDERKIKVILNNGGNVVIHFIDILNTREYKFDFEYNYNPIKLSLEFYDGDRLYKSESYDIDENNISKYMHNGFYKDKRKPKIKVVHLQTTLKLEKEINSYNQLVKVKNHGWQYVQHLNEVYDSLPPKFNCMRPDCVSMELFDENTVQRLGTALTPTHYGCYESFRNAILSEFDSDIDYLILCEGDCKIIPEMNEFINSVEKVCNIISGTSVGYVSFGDKQTLEHGWMQSPKIKDIPNQDMVYITNHIIGLQCIMFPKTVAKWLKETLRTEKWDASDIYFNSIFRDSQYTMAIVNDRITTQFDGFSLIDKQEKIFI